MRLARRRLGKGELDGELLALAVLVAAGVLGASWLLLGLPTPACVFHAVTGLPCLTCGGTRCLRNILSGHPAAALGWNPLVFAGAAAAVIFSLYAAVVVTLRLPRFRVEDVTATEARWLRLLVAGVAAANWIYLLLRFSRGA